MTLSYFMQKKKKDTMERKYKRTRSESLTREGQGRQPVGEGRVAE